MLKNLKAILLIISVGFIVYSSSFSNPFIWDDEALIVNNSYIRSWQNTARIFTSPLVRSHRFKTFFYRPLQELSYTLDFQFWQLEPFGYHLSNTLLHLINALLIFFIVKRISKDYILSLFSSLLFVIHPIHTQAVTYISGRADLLIGIFLLLSFLSHVKHFYLFSTLLFTLALFSKESAISFPLILILYDRLFRPPAGRRPLFLLKHISPLIIVILAYLYLRLSFPALYDYKMITPSATNFFLRIFSIGKIIFSYLWLLAYPAGLHMERSLSLPKSFLAPSYLFSFLILLGILAGIFIAYRARGKIPSQSGCQNPLPIFSLGWFFIFLLPMLNILKLDTLMAEHWLYLSSAGIFVLFIIGTRHFIKNKSLLVFALTLLLIFYASFTIKRNIEWGNKLRFAKRTLLFAPDSIRANYFLGQILLEEGMLVETIAQLKKTIALKSKASDTYNILGVAYIRNKNPKKAKKAFEQSIELDPAYGDPLNNLGLLYLSENKDELAYRQFQKALKTNPQHLGALNNLAVYYKKKKREDLAVKIWEKVLSIDTINQTAKKNLYRIKKCPADELPRISQKLKNGGPR